MSNFYVKIDNVYFASKFFTNKFGQDFEGEVVVSTSKLFARRYDNPDNIIRDARLLGVSIDRVTLEKIA